jgi:hypothetical protein
MSDEKTLAQREEERLLKSLAKKKAQQGPQTIEEMKKKREADLKHKQELEVKKKHDDENKSKEAEVQRQKQEKLRIQREADAKAQKERAAQEAANFKPPERSDSGLYADKEANDEANREAARFSKLLGVAPNTLSKTAPPEPHKKGLDALIEKERAHDQYLRVEPKKEEPHRDWHQEDEFLNKQTDAAADDEEAKEAERMAKMFGLSPNKLKGHNTPKVAKAPEPILPVVDDQTDDAVGAREAERMARVMGGNPKRYDPKQEAIEKEKERERKKFEDSLRGINDPKELSKAFLNDPSMVAHLRDVNGVVAVNTLKGVDVPGHHY